MREVPGRTRRPVARVLIGAIALIPLLLGCGDRQPASDAPMTSGAPSPIVMDDFESGALTGWRTVANGSGGWVVESGRGQSPGSASPDRDAVALADPPQGTSAAVTEAEGPGTRIAYRDVSLDGRFQLHMTVYYGSMASFSSPETLAHDAPRPNQQYRIDLIDPAAPIDSLARGDVLMNVFHTSAGDPTGGRPTEVSADVSPLAGQTVRLRLAATDNQGPLRVGVDNIWFESIGGGDDAIHFPDTQEATGAVDLVLHRLSEAEALQALSRHAEERAGDDAFAGAVLVARHGKVLLQDAWGLADREAGTENTPDTRFRLGSMNKMFTSVATLQLVEAGKLALDDPIGKHLPDYPNKDVASKVTVRHLLTHTGGTGDIFGPQFDQNRLKLREHSDYVELFGDRGPRFEPGARFEYSNYGFVLLGALIEAVSGTSYYEYVREHVYEPAGMASTASLPESEDVPNRAAGYMQRSFGSGPWVPNTDALPWRGMAAGGGYSTVGDISRFAEALSGGRLITRSTLAEATRPQSEEPYGYGFAMQGEGSLFSFGHGGGAPGMNGELRVFPELGYVVVILSNLDPPAASELAEFFALRMPDQ